MERLWQLCLSSRYRLPLFPTDVSQRRAVRCLARVTAGRLVLFGLVHEHGHPVVFCSDESLGLLKRSVRVSLRRVAAQPIEKVWAEPVRGRSHVLALLRYALQQPIRHGVLEHPALWSGSCFVDLVGARYLPELELRLAEALPGVRQSELYELVGLPPRRIAPAGDDLIRELGARRLLEAVAAALAVDPSLRGQSPRNVAARTLVVQVGRRIGFSWTEIQRVLPVSHAALFRLAAAPPPEAVMERAVRLRLGLEDQVQKAGSGTESRLVRSGPGALFVPDEQPRAVTASFETQESRLVRSSDGDRELRDPGVSPRPAIPRCRDPGVYEQPRGGDRELRDPGVSTRPLIRR